MALFSVENLTFTYPGASRSALDGVTLAFERGSFTVVCGKSGSGKSTLLRHLKTVLTPHGQRSGQVLLDGELLGDVPEREQATRIGFVMQDPDAQLTCDKVWHELAFGLENLGVPSDVMRVRVAEMASYFGIQNWLHASVNELSGGQKQLLNLAAVMAMQPDVLVLDEPTGQLDPLAAFDFLTTVRRLNDELGMTVIMSEHRLEDALSMADRLVVMESGRVSACGAPREVGCALHACGSDMARAMPAPLRVFCETEGALEGRTEACPLTVREGRAWLSGRLSAGRRLAIMPTEEASGHGARQTVLQVENVWFRYGRECSDVLRDLSLAVHEGEILGIVGGNGSGKSTLLRLMCGAVRPYRGKVGVLGKRLSGRRGAGPADGRVVMLPQDPLNVFVKQRVRDDLLEMLQDIRNAAERDERIREVAGLCGIEDVLDAHPLDLSGGEAQRAALAKVLLANPRILLLDEPTKGIDAFFKERLADVLANLVRAGVAVVLVSHDIEFCARCAHRVALLFDGSIACEGTPRVVFGGNGFYTTAASRMSRHVAEGAVTVEDVVGLCRT